MNVFKVSDTECKFLTMVSDKLLLCLLYIIGVFNTRTKLRIKFLSIIIVAFYYVSIVYHLAIDCKQIFSHLKSPCMYLILHVLSMFCVVNVCIYYLEKERVFTLFSKNCTDIENHILPVIMHQHESRI